MAGWVLGQAGLKTTTRKGLAALILGAITHPSLDVLTTYSVQLLSPFSNLWFHSDGLFIIDIWLWLLLSISIGISVRRERGGREWTRLPRIAIAVVLAYVALNLAITDRANAAVHDWAGDRTADAIFASPPPVLFWRRDLVWREGDCYRRSNFDPLGGGFGQVSDCQPTNMGDPIIREAVRRDPALRKFLKWSILPQAEVVRGRCSAHVAIGDARYGQGRRSRLARETVLPIGGPGCAPSLDKRLPSS